MNFFDGIYAFFETFLSFISNFFESLVTFLLIIPQVVSVPFQFLGFVPSLVGASISLVLCVAVIKLILGWGNQ